MKTLLYLDGHYITTLDALRRIILKSTGNKNMSAEIVPLVRDGIILRWLRQIPVDENIVAEIEAIDRAAGTSEIMQQLTGIVCGITDSNFGPRFDEFLELQDTYVLEIDGSATRMKLNERVSKDASKKVYKFIFEFKLLRKNSDAIAISFGGKRAFIPLYNWKKIIEVPFTFTIEELSSLVSLDLVADNRRLSRVLFKVYAKSLDMGTGVMWGIDNIGASSAGDPGTLFKVEELSDAIAEERFGHGWRLPSAQDFTELLKTSSIYASELNGTKGLRIISNKTGNSLFFPDVIYLSRPTDTPAAHKLAASGLGNLFNVATGHIRAVFVAE